MDIQRLLMLITKVILVAWWRWKADCVMFIRTENKWHLGWETEDFEFVWGILLVALFEVEDGLNMNM